MPQSYGDHPFVIQFRYTSTPGFVIDNQRRSRRANDVVKILNAILEERISLGPRYAEQYWVYEEGNSENLTARWAQRGYAGVEVKAIVQDFTDISNLSRFTFIEPNNYYNTLRPSSDMLKLPGDINESLNKVYKLSPSDRKKYNQACAWFAVVDDLWFKSHASYYIALVCAIESLISESHKCPECGQEITEPVGGNCTRGHPKYMITRRFKNFVQKYLMIPNPIPQEVGIIYQVRSKLVHGSLLFDADLGSFGLPLSYNQDSERELFSTLNKVTRLILYNWLHLGRNGFHETLE